MICQKCGKESNNVRMCAFCQTPYFIEGPDRATTSRDQQGRDAPSVAKTKSERGAAGGPRGILGSASPTMRRGLIAALALLTVGVYFITRERPIPAGVVLPNVIAAPMSPDEARVFLETVNASAKVEPRDGKLFVQMTGTFPDLRQGQLALAQQYARADAIVFGSKRALVFLDPSGNRFAEADPNTGVMMTR